MKASFFYKGLHLKYKLWELVAEIRGLAMKTLAQLQTIYESLYLNS